MIYSEENFTRCLGVSRRDPQWKFYKVKTERSTFHLAVNEGNGQQRQCAVLRGFSQGAEKNTAGEDSNPQVGNASLFKTPTHQWSGKCLEVGTVKTSAIVSVEEEANQSGMQDILPAHLRDSEQYQWSRVSVPRHYETPEDPYPKNFVAEMECAAGDLKRVFCKENLIADLGTGDPELFKKFRLYLAECALVCQDLQAQLAVVMPPQIASDSENRP